MKLVISGFELPLDVKPGFASVLEVENPRLFGRICQSLLSFEGRRAIEPYALWGDQGKEVKPKDAYLAIANPFSLPWSDREFVAGLYRRMELLVLEDHELREEMETLARDLSSSVAALGFQLSSDYRFGVEWQLSHYLKAFGFGIDRFGDDSLLDSLIKFVSLASDVSLERALLFVNLKTFLSQNDIELLYEQAFLSGIALMLLENKMSAEYSEREVKRGIDQCFLER